MRATVGLSIRANWVEVLEIQRGFKRKIQVTKFGRFPVASPERTKVVEAIKGAWEAAGIKTKEAVLAIPTQEVILRYFTLPLIPKSEWAGAIQFEARKYVPFKLDELVWDFHVSERKAQRQLDVIFVAARKEVFQEYMSLLQEAGLKVLAVEAASFGLARALTYGNPALRDTTFTAIDVCGDTAHVALVHHGVPQVARDVFLVGQSELGALEQLVRPTTSPEPLPLPPGTLEPATEQIPVAPVMSEQEQRFASLVSELRLSLDYFAREFPGQDVRHVVLCGEEVVGQWRDGLAQELKLPVELAPTHTADHAKTLPMAWTLALGLALHGSSVSGPCVNFMQHEPQIVSLGGRARVRMTVMRPIIAEVMVACAVLILTYFVQYANVARATAELRLVQQERARIELPAPAKGVKDLQALRQNVDERLALLRTTVGNAVFLTPKLSALARVLPHVMWLEGFSFRAGSAGAERDASGVMRGFCLAGEKAKEIALVNQLTEQLRREPDFVAGFGNVQLASVGSERLLGTDVTSFEVQANQR